MTQPNNDRPELAAPIIVLTVIKSVAIAMQSTKRAPIRWLGAWVERETTEYIDFILLFAKATRYDPKTTTHRR